MIETGYGSTDQEMHSATDGLATYPLGASPYWPEIIALYHLHTPDRAGALSDAERQATWQRCIDLCSLDDEWWVRKLNEHRGEA